MIPAAQQIQGLQREIVELKSESNAYWEALKRAIERNTILENKIKELEIKHGIRIL